MKKEINTRVFLRLEKDGKYIEKDLSEKMVCALFDLQYMMDTSVWETVELNKMDKELGEFFKIVGHVDDAMHGEQVGEVNKEGHIEFKSKEEDDYIFGKPEWKDIKNERIS